MSNQIKQADAVVFLTTGRAGLFLTGHLGSGLVVGHLPDGSWSAPSAIFFLGTGFGLQGGFDVTDYVLILKRQAVESFIGTDRGNHLPPFPPAQELGFHGRSWLADADCWQATTSWWWAVTWA